jgi:hypothetical protein
VGAQGLHIDRLVPLLRAVFTVAGVPFAEQHSGHSLRRGFANWATSNGWDLNLDGIRRWKEVKSAMRYVDAADPFG